MNAHALLSRQLEQLDFREHFNRNSTKLAAALLLLVMIGAIGFLVHATGGIKYVYSHAMYVPVVLAGMIFRTPGGVAAGIAGGLTLGPFMPIDTGSGELQEPINWLYRMFFFCLIGALTGVSSALLRAQIDRIKWILDRDANTGLPSRALLERELRNQLREGTLAPEFIAVVVNLDNYLEIINTLGPAITKPLMTSVFERIAANLPPQSVLCLYHSDRFVGFSKSEHSREALENLTSALRRSFAVANIHVYVDTSIGIAEFPTHGHDLEELIQKASIAMHASMAKGRTFSVYDSKSDRTSRETLALLGMIPAAIGAGEFRLFCQPKLRLADRVYTGSEVLMRWKHPVRGDIPPGTFIPYAERTSLIHLLTSWALQESFEHLKLWAVEIPDIQVAVNLTARDLGNPDLPQLIDRLAREHALTPGNIEFEITESGILSDQQSAGELLRLIKSFGFRIAIDDFGTGQSSLQYLKNLPIDTLKIDQVFVRNLLADERDQSIVKTIVAMARNLALDVTAEGVEDLKCIELLAAYGCTHAQGYAISRPFPAEELTSWIRTRTPGSGSVATSA